MAISDKLMDIKVLVEKYLDQDEIDELYELTEDIEILEQAKDLEIQRLRALAEPSSVPQANELLPHVSGSALLAAFDVCFIMRKWCRNVIAGADKEDDTTKDKEMLDKCNAFIGWFKEHYL